MSAATLRALEAAIRDHIRDEGNPGDIPTSWVMHAALLPDPSSGDSDAYFIETAAGQPAHITIGLLRLAERRQSATEKDDD